MPSEAQGGGGQDLTGSDAAAPLSTDPYVQQTLDALATTREDFRSALATTAEQVRKLVEGQESLCGSEQDLSQSTAAELGQFASGRIDPTRFAAFAIRREGIPEPRLQAIRAALETLRSLLAREQALFCIEPEPDSSLRHAVSAALADLGRAYGAARVVGLARSGRYRAEKHAQLLAAFPYAAWHRRERELAPPLIVRVPGSKLRAASLVEFLDGNQKLVLIASGESPPAPLVRLISPGVFVMQTSDPAELKRFARWPGPGIAALVPESTAKFCHDPSLGCELSERLAVTDLPALPVVGDSGSTGGDALTPLGGMSAFQQREELRQLETLASARRAQPPETEALVPELRAMEADGSGTTKTSQAGQALAGGETEEQSKAPAAGADPLEGLTAWLLGQADLSDLD